MPAPVNLSFELAGTVQGEAAGWTLTRLVQSRELAGYAAGVFNSAGDLVDAALAPQAHDSFEFWQPSVELSLGSPAAAAYSSPPLISPQTFESFEALSGWDETYLFVLATTEAASFDAVAPEAREDFEEEWATFSASATFTLPGFPANAVNVPGHPFELDDLVQFSTTGTATLPPELTAGTLYYVVAPVTQDTFQVSATSGGTAIVFTGSGTGTGDRIVSDLGHSPSFDTTIASSSSATYDRGANSVDAFTGWAEVDADAEALPGGASIDITGHPYRDGDAVIVSSSGTLPTPLVASTVYYVRRISADRIELATTPGGSGIALTGGSGTLTVRRPWRGTFDTYAGTELEGATYNGAAREDFETVRAPVPFTVSGNDILDAVGHPFSNGDQVTVESTGARPLGLSGDPIVYFVVNATANTLQLSLASGGGAVPISDVGSGVHTLRSDPSIYWTDLVTI